MTKLCVSIIFALTLVSCSANTSSNKKHADTTNETKRIVVGDYLAEGEIKIDKDTVFNGPIKFFDRTTKKLSYEQSYRNGIVEGFSQYYFPNGKTKIELSFRDGKKFGFVNYFDTTGNLISRNYMYYGIRLGPGLDYSKGKLVNYRYYDFDYNLLFALNYDSIQGHRINQLQKGFFYYLRYDVIHDDAFQKSYLLYLINPPKYKFDYSLVLVGEHYQVKRIIQEFGRDLVIAQFTIEKENRGLKYALQLKVYDSINDQTNVMFKVLE
jgi:hypothetical protein